MKKKIFYWSPCLNPVGTVKSTLNSAVSAMQYGSNLFDVTLINACGEWDEYLDFFKENDVKIISFKYKFFNCPSNYLITFNSYEIIKNEYKIYSKDFRYAKIELTEKIILENSIN